MTAAAGRCGKCGHDMDRHEMEQPYPCYDCSCTEFAFVASEDAGTRMVVCCEKCDGSDNYHLCACHGSFSSAPREQEAEGNKCPHGGTVWAGSTDCPKCAPTPSAPTALKALAATHPPLWVIVHEKRCILRIAWPHRDAFFKSADADPRLDGCRERGTTGCRIVRYVPEEGS